MLFTISGSSIFRARVNTLAYFHKKYLGISRRYENRREKERRIRKNEVNPTFVNKDPHTPHTRRRGGVMANFEDVLRTRPCVPVHA